MRSLTGSFHPLLVVVPLLVACGSSGGSSTTGTGGAGGGASSSSSSSSSSSTTSSSSSGSGGAPSCSGACAAPAPAGWDLPALVWLGDKPENAPACPSAAPNDTYEGFGDLDAPFDCGVCSCAPPDGSCTLPATLTANAATCALDGASTPHTPFNPSSGWDGSCDANQSIPAGKLCSGVKCVQSLTVAPLGMSEQPCVPSSTTGTLDAPAWKAFARRCQGNADGPCADQASVCLPPAPAGFRACIKHDGEVDCPAAPSPYTDRHVLYAGYDDTRACTACTCGTPAGNSCLSTISVFTDGACGTPAISKTITSAGPTCTDLPAGSPLGSKSATAPVFTPGACQPGGGEPSGAATPKTAATLCCAP